MISPNLSRTWSRMYCSIVSGPNASLRAPFLLSLFIASSSSAARQGGLFGLFSSKCWMMTRFSLFHHSQDTTFQKDTAFFRKTRLFSEKTRLFSERHGSFQKDTALFRKNTALFRKTRLFSGGGVCQVVEKRRDIPSASHLSRNPNIFG